MTHPTTIYASPIRGVGTINPSLKPYAMGGWRSEPTDGHVEYVRAGAAAVSVDKASLLAVVRKLDFYASINPHDFTKAFDKLRAAFTPDEIATGEVSE